MKRVVDLELKNLVKLRICPADFLGVISAVKKGA